MKRVSQLPPNYLENTDAAVANRSRECIVVSDISQSEAKDDLGAKIDYESDKVENEGGDEEEEELQE
jgi:hypothetical protein